MTAAKPITISEMIDRTADFFLQKGITSARLDAQLLIAHALGKSRLELYLHFDYPVSEDELARAREMVRRRAAREPVAYIIGKKEFAGRDFKVAPGVLIPRPDTEVLVAEVQRELETAAGLEGDIGGRELSAQEGAAAESSALIGAAPEAPTVDLRLLEFGIGSGAIAVTLAADNPALQVVATEINPAAAEIAKENAAAHAVADRVEIRLQADFAGIDGGFAGLVSNPPYIDESERSDLEPEVREYEPAEALFAEEAGLKWYRFLAGEGKKQVKRGGFVAVEIGYKQREAVEAIFGEAGYTSVKSVKDFAGNDRVVLARVPV